MRLRHIEVFNAVMQTGSVSAAARLINVTQPAVSRTLQHAELQLGFALFERARGRLTPTNEAMALFPHVEKLYEQLDEVQHQLFNLGGELSIPGFELLKVEAVAALDAALEKYNAQLPKLEEFILPAGTRGAAQAHVCRTVARRAERAVVALQEAEPMRPAPRQYLNRLSDLLFVLARVLNRANLDGLGGDDVYWRSEKLARGEAG